MTLDELLNDKNGIKALDEKNFSKVYDMLHKYDRPELTRFLLDEGIDPLNYMNYIPGWYMDLNFNEPVIIPSNIIKIGQEAFIGCKHIPKVIFEEGLHGIKMLGFGDCFDIEELDFPNSLVEINAWAFAGCSKLKEVHFKKDNLSYIGTYAFGECKNLKTITYTGTIDEWRAIGIQGDAFDQCGTTAVECIDGIYKLFPN